MTAAALDPSDRPVSTGCGAGGLGQPGRVPVAAADLSGGRGGR